MNYIIVNGSHVEIKTDVVHYPLPPKRSLYGIVERRQPPSLGVIHWTGAENPATTVLATLRARNLSVHFCIDRDGVIHQFVDPGLFRCAHAGWRANTRSVGIEVVCYGWSNKNPDPDRPRYTGVVHGWKTEMADFYPSQYASLSKLCTLLKSELDIPLSVPDCEARRLDLNELASFSGWCGHLHVESIDKFHPKCDPGPKVFDTLSGMWSKKKKSKSKSSDKL